VRADSTEEQKAEAYYLRAAANHALGFQDIAFDEAVAAAARAPIENRSLRWKLIDLMDAITRASA
jgi:hypothetical protein